jgi:hypothetical protein
MGPPFFWNPRLCADTHGPARDEVMLRWMGTSALRRGGVGRLSTALPNHDSPQRVDPAGLELDDAQLTHKLAHSRHLS